MTLTPEAAAGSTFARWSGDACPSLLRNGACRFTAAGLAKSFTATFRLKKPKPGAQVPPRRTEEVVLDVPPGLCAARGGMLRAVPSGDTTGYLCVPTTVR